METVKVQYAKTHLSALLARVEHGETVLIARGTHPVAQLTPIAPPPERELGFVPYAVPESFFAPLGDEELARWEDRG